jgi:DNA polymerase-3 subunit alpha
VTDIDIAKQIGVCSLATSEYPVSMLNMKELDDLMYVKLDILGLDNIKIINDTCKMLGIERLTPDNTDLEDEKVWKSIRDDTTMVFQWESASAQAYLRKFMSDAIIKLAKTVNPNFSYIKWFSFGNGLIRPGCASFRDNVANGEILTTGFKELDDFLSATFERKQCRKTLCVFLLNSADIMMPRVIRCVVVLQKSTVLKSS